MTHFAVVNALLKHQWPQQNGLENTLTIKAGYFRSEYIRIDYVFEILLMYYFNILHCTYFRQQYRCGANGSPVGKPLGDTFDQRLQCRRNHCI